MHAVKHKNKIRVYFPYNEDIYKEVSVLEGAKYLPEDNKAWAIKPSYESIEFLAKWNFDMDRETRQWLVELCSSFEEELQIQDLKFTLSSALSAPEVDEISKKFQPGKAALPFQWATVHYADISNGRFLLADDMGLGKTLQMLMALTLEKFSKNPVVILCPKSACTVWQKEIKDFFGQQSIIVERPIQEVYQKNIRFYICSYSQLKKMTKDMGFFWVLDEAHLLKNRKTDRSGRVKSLTKDAIGIAEITGTPIQNRADELYQLLTILDPDFMSFSAYMKKYCNAHWNPYNRCYESKSTADFSKLHKYVYSNYLIRRTKKEALPQLPDKTRQVIEIAHKRIQADSVLEMYSENAHQKAKDPYFIDFLETVFSESKSVVFYHHKEMGDAIEDVCKDMGQKYIRIDGSTSTEDRAKLIEKFQKDPNCRQAIISIKAGGTGITLTAGDVVIFAEYTWVPGDLLQAEDRCLRIGQKNNVLSLWPIFSDFERELYEMILDKLALISKVIEGECLDITNQKSLMAAIANKFGLPLNVIKDQKKKK